MRLSILWRIMEIEEGVIRRDPNPKQHRIRMSNIHKMTSYTWNFQNFTCVFTILVKFDIHFLRLPWEIFFGVITDD